LFDFDVTALKSAVSFSATDSSRSVGDCNQLFVFHRVWVGKASSDYCIPWSSSYRSATVV